MLHTLSVIFGKRGWVPGLSVLLTVLIIACGSASQPVDQQPANTQQSATTDPGQAAATTITQPTPTQGKPESTRDTAIIVTEAEPASVGS